MQSPYSLEWRRIRFFLAPPSNRHSIESMKKVILTLTALLGFAAAQISAQPAPAPENVRPTISVNAAKEQNKLAPDLTSATMLVENQKWAKEAERPFIIRATGKEVTGKEWKEYSFAFTPEKDGYLWLSLEGEYPNKEEPNKELFKVDYDKVSLAGGKLENGDFEERAEDEKPKSWSFSKKVIPNGSKPVLSGSHFVTASSGNRVGSSIQATAGQTVTVTFSARAHTD